MHTSQRETFNLSSRAFHVIVGHLQLILDIVRIGSVDAVILPKLCLPAYVALQISANVCYWLLPACNSFAQLNAASWPFLYLAGPHIGAALSVYTRLLRQLLPLLRQGAEQLAPPILHWKRAALDCLMLKLTCPLRLPLLSCLSKQSPLLLGYDVGVEAAAWCLLLAAR